MSSRAIWGILFAVTYVAVAAIMMPPLDEGFSPDTNGYIRYSPYRQPM